MIKLPPTMNKRDSGNPIDKHVGTRVRMRRMMLDKSQTELADALGVTFQQVQKYEKGTNRISASRLMAISNYLQVPVTFFFEAAPDIAPISNVQRASTAPDEIAEFMATRDGLALAKAFMRISSRQMRQEIVSLVEELTPAKTDGAAQRRA
jgi:transcriptional regulator with XRE-family HTH domain